MENKFDLSQSHGYCGPVRNITVSVDDTVYDAARVLAARHRTSVSALVRAYLSALEKGQAPVVAEEGDAQDRKRRDDLARLFRDANLVLGYRPSREKTYER